MLICEPHDDISALMELVVRRLGHEPVRHRKAGDDGVFQAAVIEPGDPEGTRLARKLRKQGVPLLFTSIFPAGSETLELQPAAYLVKPFPLYALERALGKALTGLPEDNAVAVANG